MSTFTETNASGFAEASIFYELEFLSILDKIVTFYKRIIDNCEVVENNEDKIRDYLHCNYLNNIQAKNEIGLNYHFECEPKEFGDTEGYLDIKIFNANILTNPSEYYIIECKRIDNKNLRGLHGFNAKYISEGIMRFVNKRYSVFHRVNGMIGFVVENVDIAANINNINYLIENSFPHSNTTDLLERFNGINNFEYLYKSTHNTNVNETFKLFHLMLNFSNNISLN